MTTLTQTAPVAVPKGDFAHEMQAGVSICNRELLRFVRDPGRMVASFLQPLLFLFVLGAGLGSIVQAGSGAVQFQTFLFPGVLGMSVLFMASHSGISLVWDREFGFMREMLVAPISTPTILIGKAFGGASIATLQSVVVMALAGLVGVPYDLLMMVELLLLLFLMSFLITALGLALSARLNQIQSAIPLVQLIITPMMFLSGALFPLSGLPTWLSVVTLLNPMTYAMEPVRAVVFDHLTVDAATRAVYDPGIWWGSFQVPMFMQVGIVALSSAFLLWLAIKLFARTE